MFFLAIHDSIYWRRRAIKLEKSFNGVWEIVLIDLEGIRDIVKIGGESSIVFLLSINKKILEYDSEIEKERLRQSKK